MADITVNELLYGSVEEFARTNFIKNAAPHSKELAISQIVHAAKENNITVNEMNKLLGVLIIIEDAFDYLVDEYKSINFIIRELDYEDKIYIIKEILKKIENYEVNNIHLMNAITLLETRLPVENEEINVINKENQEKN